MQHSVTKLGFLWKVLVANLLAKLVQKFHNFLGYFEKCHFYIKTADNFLGQFRNKLGILFFHIWSHCQYIQFEIVINKITLRKFKNTYLHIMCIYIMFLENT